MMGQGLLHYTNMIWIFLGSEARPHQQQWSQNHRSDATTNMLAFRQRFLVVRGRNLALGIRRAEREVSETCIHIIKASKVA